MKMFVLLASFVLSFQVLSYVPTVESLFRHSGNPDVTNNSIVLNLKIIQPRKPDDLPAEDRFFKIIMTKDASDSVRVSQAEFGSDSFSENELLKKYYNPNLSSVVNTEELNIERGLLWAMLNSIFFNDGKQLINFLKSAGEKVYLNDEILNREKIETLASYKKYLIVSTRSLDNVGNNPLRPDDTQEKLRVEKIMQQPMYSDSRQVKLSRIGEEILWEINSENFWALISHERRHPLKVRYKNGVTETELNFEGYYMFNGYHFGPEKIILKTSDGETYKIEIITAKYFNEKDEDLVRRLKRWDQVLKNKSDDRVSPKFLF